MPEAKKPTTAAANAAAPARSKAVSTVTCLGGTLAALLALIGIMVGGVDLVYLLLLIGGVLAALLGLRNLRQAHGR